MSESLIHISEQLLLAVKKRVDAAPYIDLLRKKDIVTLISEVNNDNNKKTFWINIYNAFTQIFLQKNEDQYEDKKRFFQQKKIEIAGIFFSLDEIEHGILRRGKAKWGLGYIPDYFLSRLLKKLRVLHLDYRIHFALNCGAVSCPAIAFYTLESLEIQLDKAAETYLGQEVVYHKAKNIVEVSSLFRWFTADFGGKKGIRRLLKKHQILPEQAHPEFIFKKYNWTLNTAHFR